MKGKAADPTVNGEARGQCPAPLGRYMTQGDAARSHCTSDRARQVVIRMLKLGLMIMGLIGVFLADGYKVTKE